MKKIFFLCLSLICTIISFAQERVSRSDIYLEKKLAYTKADGKLFTGIAESRTGKGHLTYQEEYKEGYKTKYTLYYNGDDVIVANETVYNEKSFSKKKDAKYSGDGNKIWYTHYDVNGNKTLKEIYENGKLIYSCEFRDNKKHGKEFCTSKKCDDLTEYYEDGKKVVEQ